MGKVFSFDLGSGSIGECVREKENVLHLQSLLIDSKFASLEEIRKQRRAYRTRLSHKAREAWWIKIAIEAGLDIPGGNIRKDKYGNYVFDCGPNMLREFPQKGDETIYNSALLRIMLVQGKKLAGWQIFKAVWSSFQHRGYDANVEWGKGDKDEEDIKASKLYIEEITKSLPQEYCLPCYYEAFKMGLWDYKDNKFNLRLSSCPGNARNKEGRGQIVAPREMVEKELRLLLENARKFYPNLPNTDYILYGSNAKPYAAVKDPSKRKYETEGILGQKTPRFDNRIISKCCLIPRLNVCKSETPLSKEVRLLMALKNFRFIKGDEIGSFDFEEVKELFDEHKSKLFDGSSHANFVDKGAIKKYLNAKGYLMLEGHEKIPAPKDSGRSRFCRPALRILKELILSGKNPHDFYLELTENISNSDINKGLVKEDYNFLLKMPNDWYKIHILDEREENKNLTKEQRMEKIDNILSSISNAIVRSRLTLLLGRLKTLSERYGAPDYCILEIGRDEFIGEEEKRLLEKVNQENFKNNLEAYDECIKYGLSVSRESGNLEKMKLFRLQKGIDIYNVFNENRTIIPQELDAYDVDHIVPISRGGADSFVNKVLTSRELNQNRKGNKTPYEWLFADRALWAEYQENLKKAGITSSLKLDLLTSDKAVELEKKRNDLQATRYIEKLAQKIISLYFGWGEQTSGDLRKMYVCTGGLTAKIRAQYNLNRLLHQDLNKEEYQKLYLSGKLDEKNRANKRHHALDALVISLAREVKYNEKGKIVLPDFAQKPPFYSEALDKVFPIELKSKPPLLRETVYALRARQEGKEVKYYMTTRFNTSLADQFKKLADAKKNVKNIFDLSVKKEFEEKLNSSPSQEEWESFLRDFRVAGNTPVYKISMTASRAFKKSEVLNEDGTYKKAIGEYKAMGKMPGQYFMPKEGNLGQIIYNNGKKWVVEQVYPFDSLSAKLKDGKEKYGKVLFWSTGITLCLPNGTEDARKIIKTEDKKSKRIPCAIKPGKYKLNTISGGDVFLTALVSGVKYAVSLKRLLEDCKAYKERG